MCEKNEEKAIATKEQKVTRREVTPGYHFDESDEAFTVKVELPGVTEKSVDLTVENRTLSITAENTVGRYEGYERVLNELPEVRYRTSFELPERVDSQAIKAAMKNGVLILTLPKRAEVKPHKIAVISD